VNLNSVEMMRVWAALTGLVLTAIYFGAVWLGDVHSDLLPMLVAGIAGFELYFFLRESLGRRCHHG
jgi:hypothetical protein